MKAILIDSENQTVKQIEIADGNDHLDSMYKALKCEMFEAPLVFNDGDTLYVDEEAMLKPISMFFEIEGAPQPYAGNGLILGCNLKNGNSRSVKMTVEDIEKKIKFSSALEMKLRAARGEFA